jgi:cation/acetate symporter
MFGTALVIGVFVLSQVIASQAGAEPPTRLGGDPLLLATPIFAGLPSVLAGLVMAGLLASALALGQAALLSAASALSYDLWDKFADPDAPEGRRLLVARLLVVAVAAAAAWLALQLALPAPALIGCALALAAAGNFAPLLLGIWWRGCTAAGAVAGICAGVGVVALWLLVGLGSPAGTGPAWALQPIKAAAAAVPAAFVVTILVSLLTSRREGERGNKLGALLANLRSGQEKAPIRERPA